MTIVHAFPIEELLKACSKAPSSLVDGETGKPNREVLSDVIHLGVPIE